MKRTIYFTIYFICHLIFINQETNLILVISMVTKDCSGLVKISSNIVLVLEVNILNK
jgi:hypothetical protein